MSSNILIERFGESWYTQLKPYLDSEEFSKLGDFLAQRRTQVEVYPKKEDIFKAFKLTPFDKVKVVLLGMDPYPNKNQAIGVSFGINQSATRYIPTSLMNIRKELEDDLGVILLDFDFSLLSWAEQGVLMLNAALTVEEKNPGSHMKHWEGFTTSVFRALNENHTGIVYILLGKKAQAFKKYINLASNYVIEAAHPAAEGYMGGTAGFFKSHIFSRTNMYLIGQNGNSNAIVWTKSSWREGFSQEDTAPF